MRVAGPFTVESLSPHRVLAADVDRDGEVSETEAITHADFIATLIEHLRKAGIQNTKKAERLKFDRLESLRRRLHPGGRRNHRCDRGGEADCRCASARKTARSARN